jgi:hypothetical protein
MERKDAHGDGLRGDVYDMSLAFSMIIEIGRH